MEIVDVGVSVLVNGLFLVVVVFMWIGLLNDGMVGGM